MGNYSSLSLYSISMTENKVYNIDFGSQCYKRIFSVTDQEARQAGLKTFPA
jgi:hypothetical protein